MPTKTKKINKIFSVIIVSVFVLMLAFTVGCNNTLQEMSIPADSAWNTILTGFALDYNDVSVMTIGDDISAEISSSEGPLAYCSDGTDSNISYCDDPGDCAQECTDMGQDFVLLGEKYFYLVEISMNRPDFNGGAVQVISDEQGTLASISFSVNGTTNQIEMVAGVSEGTFPVGTDFNDQEIYAIDNYFGLVLQPHDENFSENELLDNQGLPIALCIPDSLEDTIAIATNQPAGQYTLDCGYTLSLNLLPPYATVGNCISDSLDKHCKGLKGRDRAACNAAQIGNCHAAFNVPSSH
jgi:hypothetical protein